MVEMEQLARLPWPRGLCVVDHSLFALGRGRPRGAGGPDPEIDDKAGVLFEISTQGGVVTERHLSVDPPFRLWDRQVPTHSDIETDRPYAGLAWHGKSRNFIVCAFSGIDRPSDTVSFRKNATDAVLRFDTRIKKWFEIERHDGRVVPEDLRRSLTTTIPNQYFPSNSKDLPAGWLNGPDGLLVVGEDLYVVGKDNHALIKYDLSPLEEDPAHGPLIGTVLRKDSKDVDLGQGVEAVFDGPSAIATDGTILYVGLRTTDIVIGFPIAGPFDTARLIARLPSGSELIDLAMSDSGELFVACKRRKVWNIGIPNLDQPFEAKDDNVYATLPGNCSNIALISPAGLHVCCNVDGGAIFREAEPVSHDFA